ncbi:unnamed protein product [Linum trigynum]|uniref:Uncharacterized protein n=1 Tax=Linum trigynum TaxID=586398 RepID=A0AAV2CSW2_9ROSI
MSPPATVKEVCSSMEAGMETKMASLGNDSKDSSVNEVDEDGSLSLSIEGEPQSQLKRNPPEMEKERGSVEPPRALPEVERKEVVDGGTLYPPRKKKKWKPELGVGTNRRLQAEPAKGRRVISLSLRGARRLSAVPLVVTKVRKSMLETGGTERSVAALSTLPGRWMSAPPAKKSEEANRDIGYHRGCEAEEQMRRVYAMVTRITQTPRSAIVEPTEQKKKGSSEVSSTGTSVTGEWPPSMEGSELMTTEVMEGGGGGRPCSHTSRGDSFPSTNGCRSEAK